jgi:hypothetical protein
VLGKNFLARSNGGNLGSKKNFYWNETEIEKRKKDNEHHKLTEVEKLNREIIRTAMDPYIKAGWKKRATKKLKKKDL